MFPFLSCGGYTNVLSDVIMWFSSGGTKSVLHNDHIDNVNCLFSGTKTMYMVDYVGCSISSHPSTSNFDYIKIRDCR